MPQHNSCMLLLPRYMALTLPRGSRQRCAVKAVRCNWWVSWLLCLQFCTPTVAQQTVRQWHTLTVAEQRDLLRHPAIRHIPEYAIEGYHRADTDPAIYATLMDSIAYGRVEKLRPLYLYAYGNLVANPYPPDGMGFCAIQLLLSHTVPTLQHLAQHPEAFEGTVNALAAEYNNLLYMHEEYPNRPSWPKLLFMLDCLIQCASHTERATLYHLTHRVYERLENSPR